MNIMELFDESTMNLDLQGDTKDQIIEEMVTLWTKAECSLTKKLIKKRFMQEKSSPLQDLDLISRSRMQRQQQ